MPACKCWNGAGAGCAEPCPKQQHANLRIEGRPRQTQICNAKLPELIGPQKAVMPEPHKDSECESVVSLGIDRSRDAHGQHVEKETLHQHHGREAPRLQQLLELSTLHAVPCSAQLSFNG